MNRIVKPNSPAIWLWVPQGEKVLSDEDKRKLIDKYVNRVGKNNVDELTPGEKEILDVILAKNDAKTFKLAPYFFDYRFTEQMEGKDDLVGNPNADVKWFDDSGDETPETILYVEAMKRIIRRCGIVLNTVDDIGGARGVSKSGSIDVLNGVKRNAGLLNTLVHEFAHELLHQKYLKTHDKELSNFFVGTEQGRSKVEQQAELTAWIVLKYLGYDMQTNINYIGIWGANEKNAVAVFDTVTKVAQYIYQNIMDEAEYLEDSETALNESKNKNVHFLSGEELADLVGCGDIYRQGKEEYIGTIKETFYKNFNKINSI